MKTNKRKFDEPREVIFVRVSEETKRRLRQLARARWVTVNRLAVEIFEKWITGDEVTAMTKLTDASEMPDGVTCTETPRDQHGELVRNGCFYLVRERPFVDEDGCLIDDLEGGRRVYVAEDSAGDFYVAADGSDCWQRLDSMSPRSHWWRIADDD